jgi:rRNA maturation endonuclease Nob1
MHKKNLLQEIHISLLFTLYHSTRSFQFINRCEKSNKTFVLLSQKILLNLPPPHECVVCGQQRYVD